MNERLSSSSNSPASNRVRRGFTLMELTIVMVTMGIIAGVALPRFANSLGNRQVDVAARRLGFDINAARLQARLTAQSTSVTFNAGANTYTLTGVPDPDHRSVANTVVSLNNGVLAATLGTINLTGGGTSISFNGFGIPSKGGTITLTRGSANKQVVVDGTTGLATVP